jgi:hypothetical protein
MDSINITTGIFISILGITIVFVGYYFNKKIGILHVVIYFVASFVILTGVLLIMLYDKPSVLG